MSRSATSLLALSAILLAACESTTSVAPVSEPVLAASPNAAATHRYEVTVTNLTTGQPLSPAVAVTHTRDFRLFSAGTAASLGIQAIAEDGNPGVSAAELQGRAGVFQVVTTGAPIGRIGGMPFPSTLRFEIEAAANANYFSFATMLICTNDGFGGVNAIRLPHGATTTMVYAAAYDSGTEVNDEKAGSIVPPCFGIGPVVLAGGGGNRTAEGGVVRMHPGVAGGIGDLTAAHAWTGPVASVSIRRIR
ncbi:spondin domain-containing protein [Gemmatimonas phototrophica]|uniref:spondin domain-containing protein n=1 Tax=Gemmatimonas phototrophica TaxID=1379270 RepID=UPI00047A3EC4|nr:spondin domain-containing protein [Gemmatimonas phototrophica]